MFPHFGTNQYQNIRVTFQYPRLDLFDHFVHLFKGNRSGMSNTLSGFTIDQF